MVSFFLGNSIIIGPYTSTLLHIQSKKTEITLIIVRLLHSCFQFLWIIIAGYYFFLILLCYKNDRRNVGKTMHFFLTDICLNNFIKFGDLLSWHVDRKKKSQNFRQTFRHLHVPIEYTTNIILNIHYIHYYLVMYIVYIKNNIVILHLITSKGKRYFSSV